MCDVKLLTKPETDKLSRDDVLLMLCKVLAVPCDSDPEIKVQLKDLNEEKAKVFKDFMKDDEGDIADFDKNMENMNLAKVERDESEEAAVAWKDSKKKSKKKSKGADDEENDGAPLAPDTVDW